MRPSFFYKSIVIEFSYMKKFLYFFIALSLLVVDQSIKNFFIRSPQLSEGVFINQKFAWNLPIPNSVIIVLMIVVILFLIFLLIKKFQLYICIILAGALSNLIDRIIYGGVVDYIHTPFGGVINLADIMISLGVILIILDKRKIKT